MSFGRHRYEIFGTLISVQVIWSVTVFLVWEATVRLIHPQKIEGQVMLGTSVMGLIFNLIQIRVLHSGEGHYHLGGGDHQGCSGHDHKYEHHHNYNEEDLSN